SNETVIVNPKQPAISTVATAGPVSIGSTIDDTAHLTGTASGATGTVTFNLYGPSASAVCTTSIATRVVNVNGDGFYSASSGTGGAFTPTQAGTYYWVASYSGSAPNTLPVAGSCGDPNEASVVGPKTPTISTNATLSVTIGASISDTATIGNTAN